MRQKSIEELSKQYPDQPISDMFDYLDELRDSAVTNMFGATSYLVEEFNVDKNCAREVLKSWMDSFES